MAGERSLVGSGWPVVLLLLFLGHWVAVPAKAQEVGEVVRVQEALGMEGRMTWKLAETAPVKVGLTVILRQTRSFIRLSLEDRVAIAVGEARAPVLGTFDFKGEGEFSIEKAGPEGKTGRFLLGLVVPRGELWMALLRTIPLLAEVRTPQLRARSEGTYFRMRVDPAFGTFLAADEDSVSVKLGQDEGGESFLVAAGQWILVTPAGTVHRGAIDNPRDSLDDSPLLDCCDFRTGPPESQFP